MKEKSIAGEILNFCFKESGKNKGDIAEKMGISVQMMSKYMTSDVRLTTFGKILQLLGYELVVRKSTGNSFVNFVADKDNCADCPYKVFTKELDSIIERLHNSDGNLSLDDDSPLNKEV